MNYDQIISNVCSKHLVSESIITATDKTRSVCAIRHEVMHELKEAGYTVSQIGTILRRDHTTVLYGLKKHLGIKKEVKRMPPKNSKQQAIDRLEYHMRKISMPKGSIKEMMQDHLSEEVVEHCLAKAVKGRYSSIAEYFSDIVTEAYFLETENEQK